MIINWNVSPEILVLGPIQIRWYGLMFLTGFSLGYRYMFKVCQREGFATEKLDSLLVHMVLGTLIGARLAHCLFYDPQYYLANPIRILYVWEGGLASHGGGLGVMGALYLFSRNNPEFGLMWLFDRMALPTVLTGGFIRLGNLMNSEIYGLPTKSDWGVIFERIDKLPRHPTMLYESFCYFLIFFVAYHVYYRWPSFVNTSPGTFSQTPSSKVESNEKSIGKDLYEKKKKSKDKKTVSSQSSDAKADISLPPNGLNFGIVIALIFFFRFFIEIVKENQEAFNMGISINMGQLLSIPYFLAGLYFVVRALKQNTELSSQNISHK